MAARSLLTMHMEQQSDKSLSMVACHDSNALLCQACPMMIHHLTSNMDVIQLYVTQSCNRLGQGLGAEQDLSCLVSCSLDN